MKMMRDELAAGKVCDFVVVYKEKGKTFKQAMYGATGEICLAKFASFCKELRMKVTDMSVMPRPAVTK